jgi:hypothetical protein
VNVQPPPLTLDPRAPWNTAPTPMHLEQVTQAKSRGAKIRRATIVATISGWGTGIFAAITLLTGLLDPITMFLGIGMAVVSLIELRGAGEIKRLDPAAPRRLALNQLAFGGLLFAYGAISLWTALHQPSQAMQLAGNDPQVARMIGDIDAITRLVYIAVYGGVMLAALLGPGLTSLYYSTRGKHIAEYIRQTPQWILDLQRAGMSL